MLFRNILVVLILVTAALIITEVVEAVGVFTVENVIQDEHNYCKTILQSWFLNRFIPTLMDKLRLLD